MSEAKENTTSLKIINEDLMMERGKFEANGYTFTVYPVRLKEENDFFNDLHLNPVPKQIADGGEMTDEELALHVIALFSESANQDDDNKIKKISKFRQFVIKWFYRNDYHYYEDRPKIMPFIRWIERKVEYNHKRVRFYDLERKYGLSKAEIGRLFVYFYQLMGF